MKIYTKAFIISILVGPLHTFAQSSEINELQKKVKELSGAIETGIVPPFVAGGMSPNVKAVTHRFVPAGDFYEFHKQDDAKGSPFLSLLIESPKKVTLATETLRWEFRGDGYFLSPSFNVSRFELSKDGDSFSKVVSEVVYPKVLVGVQDFVRDGQLIPVRTIQGATGNPYGFTSDEMEKIRSTPEEAIDRAPFNKVSTPEQAYYELVRMGGAPLAELLIKSGVFERGDQTIRKNLRAQLEEREQEIEALKSKVIELTSGFSSGKRSSLAPIDENFVSGIGVSQSLNERLNRVRFHSQNLDDLLDPESNRSSKKYPY